ncbi:unnamed protein product [Prunus armeniaca]
MVLIPVHFVRLECNQSDLALKSICRRVLAYSYTQFPFLVGIYKAFSSDNRFLIRSPDSSRKLIWGLIKEGMLGKPVNTYLTNKAVYVHPTWKLLCPDLAVFPYEKHDVKKCPC